VVQRDAYMSTTSGKVAAAAAAVAALSTALPADAARGGRVGGRVGGGGGYRGGGGGGYRGGATNVYVAPPVYGRPFGFSPFGFSPFGFSPFGFGFGFGVPGPLLLLALGGLAVTSFRSSRGIEASDKAGAALCLQVACFCDTRSDSLYSRLQGITRTADTATEAGLQALVADVCLALLRTSKDWLAGRTKSETAGLLSNEVEAGFNRFVVQERAKFDENEQRSLTRTMQGQPTYMVTTLVVLLRNGNALPDVSRASDLREAIQSLAAEVSVEDNLLGAELLWTPEDSNDVMDRDDMFLNFPELITI